jgi:serine/threonine-protein phosphatase 2A regulatory subunit B''
LHGGSDGEVAGAPKRFPSSKLKLDELFLQWISLPDSQKLILSLIDDAKAGNPLVGPHGTSAWPLSPSSTTALFSATVRLARSLALSLSLK